MNIIQKYMSIYMFELERFLLTKKDVLKAVAYQSDEANTDRPLKELLKQLIETEFNQLPNDSAIEFLKINNEEYDILHLKDIIIKRVLLPEDITQEIKAIIAATKNSVYTNPDICFELIINNELFYEPVELKSTKQNSIPGSSVQQINPNEWVIFIKHSNKIVDIATGQYLHAINTKMQFPDRSPRPQVSFDELKKWNVEKRLVNGDKLLFATDSEEDIKKSLIKDWQRVLSQRWIDVLFNSTSVKVNEPWFNNNIRKFIIDFLEEYEKLNEQEKEHFKNKIRSLIIK
ncbi:MAG: hypothetical protein IJF40_01010 [Clostridia bacterium]|nr:hypothetical protein [Clostridia bacterium]